MSPPGPSLLEQRARSRRTLSTLHPGAEPGINPRRRSASESYGHFKQACVIEVADYSSDYVSLRRLSNAELVDLMTASHPESGPDDTTRTYVRWINIGGLDWESLGCYKCGGAESQYE